jgi:hypothetical protein
MSDVRPVPGDSVQQYLTSKGPLNKAVGQQKQLSKKQQDAVTEKKALVDNANMLQRYEEMLIASKDPKSTSERKRGAKLAAKAYEQHLKKVGIKNPKAHISPEAAGIGYSANEKMSNFLKDSISKDTISGNRGKGGGQGGWGGHGEIPPGMPGGGELTDENGNAIQQGGGSEYSPFPNALGKLGETINKAASGMVDFEDPAARTHGELGDNAAEVAGVNKAEAGTLRGMKRDQSRTVSDYYAAQSNLDAANQVAQLGASAGTGGAALARNVKPPDVASIGENVFEKNIALEKDANTAENAGYQNQAESIVNYGAVPQFQKQADEIKEQNNAVAEVTNAVPQENEVDTPAPVPDPNAGSTVPGDVKTNEEGNGEPNAGNTGEPKTGEGDEPTPEVVQAANARAKNAAGGLPNQEQYQKQFTDAYIATAENVKDTGKEDTVNSPWAKLAAQVNELPEVKANPKLRVGMSIYEANAGENVGAYGKDGAYLGKPSGPGSDVRIKHVKGIISDIKLKKNIQRTKQLASCISRRY